MTLKWSFRTTHSPCQIPLYSLNQRGYLCYCRLIHFGWLNHYSVLYWSISIIICIFLIFLLLLKPSFILFESSKHKKFFNFSTFADVVCPNRWSILVKFSWGYWEKNMFYLVFAYIVLEIFIKYIRSMTSFSTINYLFLYVWMTQIAGQSGVLKPTIMNMLDLNIKPAKKPRVNKTGAHEVLPLAERAFGRWWWLGKTKSVVSLVDDSITIHILRKNT